MFYPVVSTSLFHDLRECRVMNVADRREQVVLEVIVQPTERPADDSVAPGKVEGHACLMDCPGVFHASFPGDGKCRLFYAMRQLEHHGYRQTQHQHGHTVVKENDPERVEEERDTK